jgi:hypothetical protein
VTRAGRPARTSVTLCAAALALLAACGGEPALPSRPVALDPTSPSAAPRPPGARPSRPAATPSRTPSPTPTAPPTPAGGVLGAEGAFLALARPDSPRPVTGAADCGTVFPEVAGARCGALDLAGGSALWVSGTVDGAPVVRVLTQEKGGYVTRYAGTQGTARWAGASAFAAPLAGHGTDGLVVVVRLADGAATYDVLTWVKGGPLVLRAHRGRLADGRLAARDGALHEYALVPDGRYAHRTLAWDGRFFRLSPPDGVAASKVPPR